MRQSANSLQISLDGKVTLAASEGVVPAVYMDSVGVPTYGIGVTHWAIGKQEMDRLPDAMPSDLNAAIVEVFRLFSVVLRTYEDAVRRLVTVPIHQHEFDALVHFTYNVGEGNLAKSKMLRNLNAGNYDAAWTTGFHGWMKPPSLRSRRDLESDLAKNGDYAESKGIPVYKTNGSRKLAGRLKVMRRSEVVSLLQGGHVAPVPPVYAPPVVVAAQVPDAVATVVADADKPLSTSTSAWAIFMGLGGSGYTFWQSADDGTRIAIGITALVLVYLFQERLRKINLGRVASMALGKAS